MLPKGPSQGWDALSSTERRVVAQVREGLTNPEIAARLYVSRRTVSTHLYRIFKKLEVKSRAELAAKAVQREIERDE